MIIVTTAVSQQQLRNQTVLQGNVSRESENGGVARLKMPVTRALLVDVPSATAVLTNAYNNTSLSQKQTFHPISSFNQ